MTPLERALEALVGREPTAEEVKKFYQVKEACGFSEHDAVWSLLLAFGHYEILYGAIPAQIAAQAQELLVAHRAGLAAELQAAVGRAQATLQDTIGGLSQPLAQAAAHSVEAELHKVQRRGLMRAVALSLGVAALALIGVGTVAFQVGLRDGAAAAAWAVSADGRAARRFGQINDLQTLLLCPAPFTRKRTAAGTYCLPYDAASQKAWGWRIP